MKRSTKACKISVTTYHVFVFLLSLSESYSWSSKKWKRGARHTAGKMDFWAKFRLACIGFGFYRVKLTKLRLKISLNLCVWALNCLGFFESGSGSSLYFWADPFLTRALSGSIFFGMARNAWIYNGLKFMCLSFLFFRFFWPNPPNPIYFAGSNKAW